MTDISGLDSMTCEELRFKREDAQQPVDGPLHERQPAFPPCPHLGRDQVNHGNLQVLQAACQSQVKIRAIGKDCYFRLLLFRSPQQLAVLAINSRNMRDYFDQADHGQAGGIHHRPNPSTPHSRSSAAKEFKSRITPSKRLHKSSGIEVPGRLPRRNQDFVGHCLSLTWQDLTWQVIGGWWSVTDDQPLITSHLWYTHVMIPLEDGGAIAQKAVDQLLAEKKSLALPKM